MLSSIVAPHAKTATRNQSTRRTPILQRMLNFLEIPIPEIQVWETLEDEQRILAIEVLARLIVEAICPTRRSQEDHDR
jgi:hypothetical protein